MTMTATATDHDDVFDSLLTVDFDSSSDVDRASALTRASALPQTQREAVLLRFVQAAATKNASSVLRVLNRHRIALGTAHATKLLRTRGREGVSLDVIATAAGLCGDVTLVPLLSPHLDSPARGAIALALGRLAAVPYTKALCERIPTTTGAVQRALLWSVARLDDPTALPFLLDYVQHCPDDVTPMVHRVLLQLTRHVAAARVGDVATARATWANPTPSSAPKEAVVMTRIDADTIDIVVHDGTRDWQWTPSEFDGDEQSTALSIDGAEHVVVAKGNATTIRDHEPAVVDDERTALRKLAPGHHRLTRVDEPMADGAGALCLGLGTTTVRVATFPPTQLHGVWRADTDVDSMSLG
jgi:hypothetical protein